MEDKHEYIPFTEVWKSKEDQQHENVRLHLFVNAQCTPSYVPIRFELAESKELPINFRAVGVEAHALCTGKKWKKCTVSNLCENNMGSDLAAYRVNLNLTGDGARFVDVRDKSVYATPKEN